MSEETSVTKYVANQNSPQGWLYLRAARRIKYAGWGHATKVSSIEYSERRNDCGIESVIENETRHKQKHLLQAEHKECIQMSHSDFLP